ncbi:histone deacetylase family protein [Qipengyuania sp. S6317L1]|uniref:histone deacetylase family protein n=1 Tax=Qipengyuania sp. S6317L1 TaxID=2926410 RepID=UPI001FF3F34F|nr:histone deacetylase family protein [Qipengyuania sp. S6317L1]MCK0099667.1 histone deacetylase family protein [Qipengyuania sp. S6317L1]
MKRFFSEFQTLHAPLRELNNGEWMEFAESPARVASMLDALGPVETPTDHGLESIHAVHDTDYVEFLESAHADWLEAGREGDAIGYAFPAVHRRKLDLARIDGRLGAYGFDAATPIASGTWKAAYWGAQTALSAFDEVANGDTMAFALCRPPGHHSGRDYFGGYCFLNNAAIVAQAAATRGLGPVAILDVDYHHGNGTQDIFYERGDVFFASIHADPAMDYPYFWGHADEVGAVEGEGATFNQPLPRGTTWEGYAPALDRALDRIARFGAKFLVISYGADTFEADPISHLKLTTQDMGRIGERIATLALPSVTVMEGGYNIEALGRNVDAFINGLTR